MLTPFVKLYMATTHIHERQNAQMNESREKHVEGKMRFEGSSLDTGQ
jgi:hypothetical protein